jgi:hypothetical protein
MNKLVLFEVTSNYLLIIFNHTSCFQASLDNSVSVQLTLNAEKFIYSILALKLVKIILYPETSFVVSAVHPSIMSYVHLISNPDRML